MDEYIIWAIFVEFSAGVTYEPQDFSVATRARFMQYNVNSILLGFLSGSNKKLTSV